MPKKIFELAKELDMRPLDLVEELKDKGFNVRNHMNSLSDEEVEKAMAFLAPASSGSSKKAKKKTVKKKVVKKKVVKKKTTTKKATPAKAEEEVAAAPTPAPIAEEALEANPSPSEEVKVEAAPKAGPIAAEDTNTEEDDGAAKKRSAVVRKTAAKLAEEKEAKAIARAEEATKKANEDALKAASDSERSVTGLRVVARAPKAAPPVVEETVVEEKAVEAPGDKKEYLEEKVHKFTPVYIPSKSNPPAASSDGQGDKAQGSSTDPNAPKTAATAAGATGERKKLGGLATTMLNAKKASSSRSQLLNEERANSELKSYSTLSGIGRPLYTTVKRRRNYSGPTKGTEITEVKDSKRVIRIEGSVTGVDLARKLRVKFKELVDKALDLNLLLGQEDHIGLILAEKIAALYQYRVEDIAFDEAKMIDSDIEKEVDALPERNPIITIMGHVDHGKTTLIDYIRSAKVASGEAGGITQHIGAYSVEARGKQLTFLDTPGHAAFASMRQRGANVTDIVILVVAADDGVMPQTKESVRFCQEAGVPIIVAVNKMDKEGVNPDRIKTELAEFNITPEEWGGDVIFAPISALKGDGIDELLDSVALMAEMGELRADPKGRAEGVVIESKVEPGRGPVSTFLVQKGTLKKGDSVVVGECYGRARNLTDQNGKQLNSAGPSIPVQILGLNEAASPGDIFNIVKSEREAKKIVQNRAAERKEIQAVPSQEKKLSLEDFFAQSADEAVEAKDLNLIIRADVQGSYEAIKQSLETLGNNEVKVKVVSGGVGPITDTDVKMASSARGFIIGFNMRPVTSARKLAEDLGVDVKTYSIIYELINDVTLALEGLLEPEFVEKFIGRAEVKETFVVPKIGTVAGTLVVDGKIQRGCHIRLIRDGKIMHDGKLSSLRRFKDDVKEVATGYECGMGLENYNDLKNGDIFECYILEEQKRSLVDNHEENHAGL